MTFSSVSDLHWHCALSVTNNEYLRESGLKEQVKTTLKLNILVSNRPKRKYSKL